MPSNRLILCHRLLLLPSIFPSTRVFSSESALPIWWPKYWSFSFFSSRPSNGYSGLIPEVRLSVGDGVEVNSATDGPGYLKHGICLSLLRSWTRISSVPCLIQSQPKKEVGKKTVTSTGSPEALWPQKLGPRCGRNLGR